MRAENDADDVVVPKGLELSICWTGVGHSTGGCCRDREPGHAQEPHQAVRVERLAEVRCPYPPPAPLAAASLRVV